MKKVALVLILAAAAVVIYIYAGTPRTSEQAVARLRQACSASRDLRYIATVNTTVSYCASRISTQSIVRHKNSVERIEYISGPARGTIIVARNGETSTYKPDSGQLIVALGSGKDLTDLDLLIRNYHVSLSGRDTVAGRTADIVELIPRYSGNPSKKLWIDREKGIILRSEDRTASGKIRSTMEFTSIDFLGSISDAAFEHPANAESTLVKLAGERKLSRAELGKSVGISVTSPTYLPRGYILDSMRTYSCGCDCGHKAAHLRYTNGLNSISVFETPADGSCNHKGCRIHCSPSGRCEVRDVCQARIATTRSNGRSIIVVADLSEKEITKLVRSIH